MADLGKFKAYLKTSRSNFNESLLLETGDDEGKRKAIAKLIDKTLIEIKDFDVADSLCHLKIKTHLRMLEKQIEIILSQEKRS